jgi:mannose-6-phosphate isomerase-like protein (cupin superfamily)
MKITAAELLQRIPGPITGKWPRGEPFAVGLRHGSMLVELFAPAGIDTQSPHAQDELYFVHAGSGTFVIGAERHSFGPGTCFFVPAGVAHKFEDFSPDFSTWVVFWGPQGGEIAPQP